MTFPSDDPVQLFVPANVEAPPRYAVGVLEAWNPDTFENVVRYRGAELRNLAVISGIEALSFETGITVSLLGSTGTGALASFAILGRYVQPGSGATTEAIKALQSTVAREISAEIFAERITVASEPAGVTNGDTAGSYISLTGGPVATGIEVSPAGVMLIWIDSRIQTAVGSGATGESTGECSPNITGATSIAAGLLGRKEFGQVRGTATFQHNINDRSSTLFIATGLSAGTHSVEVRYRVFRSGTGVNVTFAERNLAVIAL